MATNKLGQDTDSPYVHISSNGSTISAATLDLRGHVLVEYPRYLRGNIPKIAADVAEAMAYHAIHVRPKLNGFSGYDCINYIIAETG